MSDEKKIKGNVMSDEDMDKVSGGVMSVQSDPTAKYASSSKDDLSKVAAPQMPVSGNTQPMGGEIPDPTQPGGKPLKK